MTQARRGTLQWLRASVIAGLCGSAAHSLLMYVKDRAGLLPTFQPYDNLQMTLAHLTGSDVHPLLPWALSFLNGSTFVGFLFGHLYPRLPGDNGATKGLAFGVVGWILMGAVFFPLVGLGFFGFEAGLGIWPLLFALAMLLTYSVVMGMVYAALSRWPRARETQRNATAKN
jgi:hypothetical protein